MTDRIGFAKRIAVGIAMGAVLISGASPAVADPEPEDQIRALLLSAEDVFAAGVSPTAIFVAWKDKSLIETGFRIEMAFDEEGPFTEVQRVGACAAAAGNCLTFVDFPGSPSDTIVRWFRVIPFFGLQANVGGNQIGSNDPILEGAPSLPDPAILGPNPPTNLRCNGNAACLQVQSITLTWTDNSDEALFWIMRARGAINPQFGTEPVATVPANTTSYSDVLSDFSTTFFYRVIAVREINIARANGTITPERSFGNSVPDRIKVETPPIPPPLDPSGLSAQFIPPKTVRLAWTDVAIDEDGFFVEMGPTATTWESQLSTLPNPGVGTVVWQDTNVPPDTKRCYRVRAFKYGPAYSGFTNTACLGSIPRAPTGLIATAISNSQVNLAWNDNSNAEDAYLVERCPGICTHSSGTWTEIGQAPADSTRFSDTNTVALTTYSYRVFASNASGKSAPSNVATTTTKPAPLPAPSNLVATAIGSHRIQLTWKDNSSNETGFRIEYKNIDGDWETLNVVGLKSGVGGTVTYVDRDTLRANQKRCYRVRAVKGPVEVSDPSNVDCATTLPAAAPNGAPSNLAVIGILDRSANLEWMDNATNEDKFRVEVVVFEDQHCSAQNITGIPWTPLAEAAERANTGMTGITLTDLIPHSAYFFRVIAVNIDGESGPSNVAGCAQTLGPPKPIFKDPNANADVEATRCNVKIAARRIENAQPHVDTMRLLIMPSIPGGPPYDRIELNLDGKIVGPQPNGHVSVDPTSGEDIWQFDFKFRKGIAYGLIATSYGAAPTKYPSVDARLRDITVLADCPQSGL